MEFISLILIGISVGFVIGLTGVGGGSLMTPLLLLFGFPPHVAVGTDLLYASVTKISGIWAHRKQNTINWKIVFYLAIASIPSSIVTIILLHFYFEDAKEYAKVLTTTLGMMLIFTSLILLTRGRLQKIFNIEHLQKNQPNKVKYITILVGALLGILVTLSSVGAGVLGTAALLIIYSKMRSVEIVGTELTHAVPLTLVAGLGHLTLGNINYQLLFTLLIGSVPAVYIGARLAAKIPDNFLRPILAIALFLLGLKTAWP